MAVCCSSVMALATHLICGDENTNDECLTPGRLCAVSFGRRTPLSDPQWSRVPAIMPLRPSVVGSALKDMSALHEYMPLRPSVVGSAFKDMSSTCLSDPQWLGVPSRA
jgi:hypothetical protein